MYLCIFLMKCIGIATGSCSPPEFGQGLVVRFSQNRRVIGKIGGSMRSQDFKALETANIFARQDFRPENVDATPILKSRLCQ